MRIALFVLLVEAALAVPERLDSPRMRGIVHGTVSGVSSPGAKAQLNSTSVPYLTGVGPCIAIEAGWSVDTRTRLLTLAPGKEPTEVTIEELRPWTGPSYGGPRRPPTDFTHWYYEDVMDYAPDRAVPAKSLSRVSISPEEGDVFIPPFFAIEPQPARIIVAGKPRIVGPAERRRLFEGIRHSLPASWTPARTLVRAQRYGPTRGHEVIELSVGWPTRNAAGMSPAIEHVAIRRFFFVDGRVAASQDYERTSGVEERVDLEGPQLT